MTDAKALPVPPVTHDLKVAPEFFDALADGSKGFEMRFDDRSFRVGDRLLLREWTIRSGYSGRELDRQVTYLLRGGAWGVMPGFVCLGIKRVDA